MTIPTATPFGFVATFKRLLDAAIPFRRVQLLATLALTLAGAFAELCTLGAVLPLLAIAANPHSMDSLPVVGSVLNTLSGWLDVGPVIAAAIILTVAALGATFVRLGLMWTTQKLFLTLLLVVDSGNIVYLICDF